MTDQYPDPEAILCGAFLRGNVLASDCMLSRDDFGESRNRLIYETCLKLESEKLEASLLTVSERLPALVNYAIDLCGLTDRAFGVDFLQLSETVRRNAQRRRLAVIFDKGKLATESGENPEKIADEAWNKLAEAITNSRTSGTRNLAVVIGEVLDRRNHPEKKVLTIPSGISILDGLLNGGFKAGSLIVVGARPNVGKSALLLSFVANAAAAGYRSLFVSLEMKTEENAERHLALSSGLPLSWFSNDVPLSDAQMSQIAEGQARFNPALIEEYDEAECTIGVIRRQARRMKATGGLDLIVVDYLGLLIPETKGTNRTRNDEVSELSRELKRLAMDFGVPVIAAHQLNRAGVDVPKLEHLRDSGAVEQDANVVFLLHNPGENVTDSANGAKTLDLLIAKNRQGRTGKIQLFMNSALMRFGTESFAETWERSPFEQ